MSLHVCMLTGQQLSNGPPSPRQPSGSSYDERFSPAGKPHTPAFGRVMSNMLTASSAHTVCFDVYDELMQAVLWRGTSSLRLSLRLVAVIHTLGTCGFIILHCLWSLFILPVIMQPWVYTSYCITCTPYQCPVILSTPPPFSDSEKAYAEYSTFYHNFCHFIAILFEIVILIPKVLKTLVFLHENIWTWKMNPYWRMCLSVND